MLGTSKITTMPLQGPPHTHQDNVSFRLDTDADLKLHITLLVHGLVHAITLFF